VAVGALLDEVHAGCVDSLGAHVAQVLDDAGYSMANLADDLLQG
jgi:hypothetical protein